MPRFVSLEQVFPVSCFQFHFIVDHMITSKIYGMVTTKCKWIPDVSTTRTIQPVDSNMTHLAFNILMATGTNSCYSEMFYILYNSISFETEVHGRT